jgi:hypothetical protein
VDEAPPTLTLEHSGTAFVDGVAVVGAAALPAAVTVKSSRGGTASRAVTVRNQ